MARGSTGRMARSEASAFVPKGGTRVVGTPADDDQLIGAIRNYEYYAKNNPEEMEVIKKNREATSLDRAKKLLALVVQQRLEASKDPNWKGNDEINDPKSPFNINNVKASIENQTREFSYQYDANGDLVSWSTGKTGSVRSYHYKGQIVGGVDIHNHPADGDRALGLQFSDADFLSYHKSGVSKGIVFAREGTYTLELPPDFKERSRIALEGACRIYAEKLQMTVAIANMAQAQYLKQNPGANEERVRDLTYIGLFKEWQTETRKFAENYGIKYSFKPNPGFEGLVDGKPQLPTKVLVDQRSPHLRSFKTPEGKTIKPARKKREPFERGLPPRDPNYKFKFREVEPNQPNQ